ncbi:MAG TPA: serine/threonine-protein kinase [Vicinamibacterales bacterium]|nr:serine/threonine-protein kinase [Vicinamibacterales bacterium]
MSGVSTDLESLFARFVEAHVVHGQRLSAVDLCGARVELVEPLNRLIERYLSITTALDADDEYAADADAFLHSGLPRFEGFQTIERLGAGGMGEVFKLRDLTLNRIVAGKVIRRDVRAPSGVGDFLREARSLALFEDRRIVRIFEFRMHGDQPLIVMEHVDGFELGRIGPSLEFRQRARVLIEVCDAIQHAHALGLQHRDLKPSNIMVDAQLTPRILDFGLSSDHPYRGHLKGTLQFVAPEQLDPSQPIDNRTDVYALGVILYELLCGCSPYGGASDAQIIAAIRSGTPRLPVEIAPRVPEPLQAIALKAMERDPADRYQSAREMAADLQRYLDGRAVEARPSMYSTTLGARVAPHVLEIGEWLRLHLIYPHEAERLYAAYSALDTREDDWIVESRTLSYSQIALYLGAFLLVCGSVFYFAAHRWYDAVRGVVRPLVVLGIPFAGLNAAAHLLYRRDHKAVAVAFYLAAVGLLPLLLIILFHETGFLVVAPDTPGQLFDDGSISNRQLQLTTLVAAAWCGALALRTRTGALSTVCAALVFPFGLAVLADFGLRSWLEDGRWDLLALHAAPLVAVYAALGVIAERQRWRWLARPPYAASVVLLVAVLELLALDGRTFHYLGFSLQAFQSATVTSKTLIDTLAAMTVNGVAFYGAAALVDRHGTTLQAAAARLLFAISPFAMLQPLGYLVRTGEYSLRYDWIYLALAISVALLSHRRQRRAFYYAGVLNTGAALLLVADHRQWFDDPWWAIAVIAAGLLALVAGFLIERKRRIGTAA